MRILAEELLDHADRFQEGHDFLPADLCPVSAGDRSGGYSLELSSAAAL